MTDTNKIKHPWLNRLLGLIGTLLFGYLTVAVYNTPTTGSEKITGVVVGVCGVLTLVIGVDLAANLGHWYWQRRKNKTEEIEENEGS